MKSFDHYTKKSAWAAALLTMSLVAGCGGGNWDSTPGSDTGTPTAPTVTNTSPGNEAVDVAVTTALNVTFSAAISNHQRFVFHSD